MLLNDMAWITFLAPVSMLLVQCLTLASPTTGGGRAPGSSRRCSRPARPPATWRWARSGSTSSPRWSGRPPNAPRRSPTCAPCAAGSSTTSRRRSWNARSSAAPAGCATSSSPSSCCNWCTAGATRRCGRPAPCRPAGAGRRRLRRPGRRRGAAARLPLPARRRAPAAAAGPAPHPHRARPSRPALRWLAAALGYTATPGRSAVEAFRAEWVTHAAEVRRLHAKLLYRPLLESVARVPADGLRLTPEAARHRLEILGFADPAGALRHLQALTGGVSRTAAIQRTLLPVLLSEFADAPEPDRGLLNYRQVSDTLGSTPWYLRLLRDAGPVARRLARVLASPGTPPTCWPATRRRCGCWPRRTSWPRAAARCSCDGLRRGGGPARRTRSRRPARSARCAAGSWSGSPAPTCSAAPARSRPPDPPGPARPPPAWPTSPTSAGARRRHRRHPGRRAARRPSRQAGPAGLRFAVIGMGRLGGYESNYLSDADVLFVYDPPPGLAESAASAAAHAIAEELRRLLSAPAARPAAGRRRRPAPGGPAGSAGPQPRRVRAVLRPLVEGVGGAGAAARPVRLRRRRPGRRVRGDGRPGALPGRRADPRAGRRDPPDQGAGGDRAAAPRRRPGHPHQAGPGRAGRRRVGGAAAPAPARGRGPGAARHPYPRRPRGGRATPAWSTRRTPPRWPPAGPWPRRSATR